MEIMFESLIMAIVVKKMMSVCLLVNGSYSMKWRE